MRIAAAPVGIDDKKCAPDGEKDAPASILVAGDSTVEESPPIVRHFTLESQKEVTIRQVAPLVIVLTGATFLNASNSPPTIQVGLLSDNRHRRFRLNPWLSSCPKSAVISTSQRHGSSGWFLLMLLQLGRSSCFGESLETYMASGSCSSRVPFGLAQLASVRHSLL